MVPDISTSPQIDFFNFICNIIVVVKLYSTSISSEKSGFVVNVTLTKLFESQQPLDIPFNSSSISIFN